MTFERSLVDDQTAALTSEYLQDMLDFMVAHVDAFWTREYSEA